MKTLVAILLFATLAQAMPRFLIIPMENIQYVDSPYHHRVARSAWPDDDGPALPPAAAFVTPENIRHAEEQMAAGSGPSPQVTGDDAVDYGAYTGIWCLWVVL